MSTLREEITVFGRDAVEKAKAAGLGASEFPVAINVGYLKFDFVDSENDPRYTMVKSWLTDTKIRHSSYFTSIYSENELRESDWVCVQNRVDNVIESEVSSRIVLPGECAICGALNQYSGPVCPLEPPRKNQLVTCTNAGEWLIRKDVCEQFSSELGPIKGKEWCDWGEIQLESVPYKLGDSSADLICESPCDGCEREGYFVECLELLKLAYSECAFGRIKSGFWASNELMGNSIFNEHVMSRACPLLYVPGEVAAILLQQKNIDFCVVEFCQ